MAKAQVTVRDFSECPSNDRLDDRLKKYAFCAGEEDYVICTGDYGGPLICPWKGGDHYIMGVASDFQADTNDHSCTWYAYYTAVAPYVDWIEYFNAKSQRTLNSSNRLYCSSVLCFFSVVWIIVHLQS